MISNSQLGVEYLKKLSIDSCVFLTSTDPVLVCRCEHTMLLCIMSNNTNKSLQNKIKRNSNIFRCDEYSFFPRERKKVFSAFIFESNRHPCEKEIYLEKDSQQVRFMSDFLDVKEETNAKSSR